MFLHATEIRSRLGVESTISSRPVFWLTQTRCRVSIVGMCTFPGGGVMNTTTLGVTPPNIMSTFRPFARGVTINARRNECWTANSDNLTDPLHWRKPRRIFVNSMSDLFHEDVPREFILKVFAVASFCPHHQFQILTKRPDRTAELVSDPRVSAPGGELWDAAVWLNTVSPPFDTSLWSGRRPVWPLPNVWLGTSIESDDQLARAWELLKCPAAVRFLSCEPLLGPIANQPGQRNWTDGIDWVIVGGESGPGARPCPVEAIRSVVRQCQEAGVPCFVKQWGSKPVCGCGGSVGDWAKNHGERRAECSRCGMVLPLIDRKGGDPAEWPEDLRVRQFPEQEGKR